MRCNRSLGSYSALTREVLDLTKTKALPMRPKQSSTKQLALYAQLWQSHRPISVLYPFILGCILSGKLPSSYQPGVPQSIVCWPDEVCQKSTSGPSYSFFFSLG